MLLKPLITEKTSREAKTGRYAFAVSMADTKTDAKKMIEKTFKVKVVKVQSLIVSGKLRRTGKRGIVSRTKDWKKVIVTLKQGEKIDLWP